MTHRETLYELRRVRELYLSNAIDRETWAARVIEVMERYKRP